LLLLQIAFSLMITTPRRVSAIYLYTAYSINNVQHNVQCNIWHVLQTCILAKHSPTRAELFLLMLRMPEISVYNKPPTITTNKTLESLYRLSITHVNTESCQHQSVLGEDHQDEW